jgi:hypothetical protein
MRRPADRHVALDGGCGNHRRASKGVQVRFPGRSRRHQAEPYAFYPPYEAARAELLARRPEPGVEAADRPFGPIHSIAVDVGLDDYLFSVYVVADGSISIYSSAGIHSTGLRGAPKVAAAAATIVNEVRETLGRYTPVADLAALPLPDRGRSQVLVRTHDGDLVASNAVDAQRKLVDEIAAMAFLLTRLARSALAEGFDRVEAGDIVYTLAPDYRRIRSALLDWLPEHLPATAKVAGVLVEFGDAETQTVTSLFAFADGSTSVYRSDGAVAEGLSETPGIAAAAAEMLGSVAGSLAAFGPAGLFSPPQPGHVQFVIQARFEADGEWIEAIATASRGALAGGGHPLSAAFACATEILRIAG